MATLNAGSSAASHPRIHVVAGILADGADRVLLAERHHDKPFPGLWEFPGGKVAPGESPAAALDRELGEELGIEVTGAEPFLTLDHDYADWLVHLDFFLVSSWRREVRAMEGQRLRWLLPAEIDKADVLSADAPVIDALRRRSTAGAFSRR